MMERYSGETFRFRFDPGVAYRLNEGMRGHDHDVRRDWRVTLNGQNEIVVMAGPILTIIPRECIARVEYTDDTPPNGSPGAWPSDGTFWAVPSLTNLVSIQMDPPVEGHYGQGQWPIGRVVVSLRESDRFIELVKPASQGEVTNRGADLPGDEDLDVQLAPEEAAHELCITYLRKALEALQRLADHRGVPKAHIPHVDFGTFPPSHMCKEIDDYNRLIAAAHVAGQLRMSELHRCVDRLLFDGTLIVSYEDKEGKATTPPPGFNPTTKYEPHFATVLLAMLRRWETFDLTDEQLGEAFDFFFHGTFTERAREWHVTIPLLRLDCGTEVPIQLDGTQLAIERFMPEQKDALWNLVSFPDTMEMADFRSFSRARFALTGVEVRAPGAPELASDPVAVASDFISALRLSRAGDVGASGVFSKERGAFEFRAGVAAMQDRFGVRRLEGEHYVLDAGAIDGARQTFRYLRDLAPQQRSDVDVALRWFNQSYRRDQPEDRIVDLTIALESTLLHGLEGELRFRAAVRGVVLLAHAGMLATTQERMRARDTLMTLYDARSKIVHEGASLHSLANERRYRSIRNKFQASNPGATMAILADRCEAIVRNILKVYVAEMSGGRTIEEINDDLDLRLISDLAASAPLNA